MDPPKPSFNWSTKFFQLLASNCCTQYITFDFPIPSTQWRQGVHTFIVTRLLNVLTTGLWSRERHQSNDNEDKNYILHAFQYHESIFSNVSFRLLLNWLKIRFIRWFWCTQTIFLDILASSLAQAQELPQMQSKFSSVENACVCLSSSEQTRLRQTLTLKWKEDFLNPRVHLSVTNIADQVKLSLKLKW